MPRVMRREMCNATMRCGDGNAVSDELHAARSHVFADFYLGSNFRVLGPLRVRLCSSLLADVGGQI
jgi:hypothetical protein